MMGAGHAYLSLDHLLLVTPGPHTPHWRTHVSPSEAQFLSQLPALPDLYLLHLTAPLASHPVGSASTRSPLGT